MVRGANRCNRVCGGFLVRVLLASFLITPFGGGALSQEGCEYRTVSSVASPDGVWTALVQNAACSNGAFTTILTDAVRLIQVQDAPLSEGIVLSIDTVSSPEARPTVRWDSTRRLSITVPNAMRPFVLMREDQYQDVRIAVTFD